MSDASIAPEMYRATLQQAWLIARMVKDMPLAEAIQAANRADTIAPIFDPTLWMKNGKRMHQDAELMRLLRAIQAWMEVEATS